MQVESYKIDCPHWSVINTILDSIKDISQSLRNTPVVKLDTVNMFGD